MNLAHKGLCLFNAYVRLQNHVRQVVGNAAPALSLESPVKGQSDLMHGLASDAQWPHAPRDQRACLDFAARCADGQPAAVLDAAFRGQFGAEFGEERGLERVQPGHPARHRSADMVFSQSVRGHDDWIAFVPQRNQSVVCALAEVERGRVALLSIQGVLDRRLRCFIVSWQWPILQALWREEPAFAVRLHQKWIAAGVGVDAQRAGRRCIIWPLFKRKIWYVEAGPLLLLLVPPDVLLAFGPGLARGIRRGAIVENAPIRGPGEAPAQESVALWIACGCPVVFRRRVHSAINPRTARRGAVSLERGEAWNVWPVVQMVWLRMFRRLYHLAIDLLEHKQVVRLVLDAPLRFNLGIFIIPEERLNCLIFGGFALQVQFFETFAQVIDEP